MDLAIGLLFVFFGGETMNTMHEVPMTPNQNIFNRGE